ncbi:MAG: primosomal protein N' [Eubacteriales bacterium]
MQFEENREFEYAGVYILDNPYSIDVTYDYFIPHSMRGEIGRGVFVSVPFGRSNRRQMALVWSLSHTPSYKDAKPIEAICTDRAPLSDEMLGLCEFMKEQVLCTMGEAVRCAVPSSAIGKMNEFYYPLPTKGPDTSSGFSPVDLFVYEYIVTSGGRSLDAIKVKFGAAAARESVDKLLSKGYIGKEMQVGRTAGEVFENFYTLAIPDSEAADILDGKAEIKLRSQIQKAVIGALIKAKQPISAEELSRNCSAGQAQFKALIDKGLIRLEARRIWRVGILPSEPAERKDITLNAEQAAARDEIVKELDSGKPAASLLFGVTGSGKTSVIISAIDAALKRGRGVIMLLPEIALTPQTLKIFSSRYGDRVAVIHSGLSQGERYDSYMKIKSGEADLVVGTRSAVFAPVQDLGLIIIDEEHESTYKSDTSPKYHARDIARFRCAYNNAVMLLSSATPSLESFSKAREGKYKLLRLKERYGNAVLPDVKIYDMRNEQRRGNTSPIGRLLKEQLREVADRGEQSILFLNRRGYNTSVSCRSCGETLICPNCSISLNYHTRKGTYDDGFLFCHFCGFKSRVPDTCPSCKSEHLQKIGFGTQRLERELSELLPDKKILRMDADSTSAKNSLPELLTKFKNREADVLLGTQMVTKGHDFPNVTLVGVLLADMSIYMDDYHANERTFSMLTQVIGRAGRSEKKGIAIIQTNNPDNDTIKLACAQDYEAFYESEIRLRKLLVFPPYCDIALINIACSDEKQAVMGAARVREEIDRQTSGEFADVKLIVFGPFESPVYKAEGKYRMRIVIKCRLNKRSREFFSRLLADFGKNNKSRASMSVNFNPTAL